MIDKNKITVIVPAYNEDLAIGQVVSDLLENFSTSEIIIVDDGSTDRTLEKIRSFNVKIISHKKNKGYGAALKSGIKAAIHNTIVTMDADGEHSARSIEDLLQGFELCAMVVGKRTSYNRENLIRMMGKSFLWWLANFTVGYHIPDINSGLRVFHKGAVQQWLDFLPDTFSFHTTSTLLCIFNKRKVRYVPIETFERKGLSKVDIYSGIVSMKKIFLLTLFMRPVRAFLMILMPLILMTSCAFFILNILASETNYLNVVWVGLFMFGALGIIELLTRSNKNLISTKTLM